MTNYMHCRPYYGTNPSICSSSFFFVRPGYFTPLNYQNYTPSYHYHDQVPPPAPRPLTPRRRRRLEDPITTYASNYYATLPGQMSQLSPQQSPISPSQPPPPPSLPPPRRHRQRSDHCGAYCDLYNLLEHPSPPPPPPPPIIKQRRKYNSNDFVSRRPYRPTDFENVHTKLKNTNDRKCHHHHHQPSCYYKEKKRQDDKLLPTEQCDRSIKETKIMNNIHPRRSTKKGFFRRIVRNYLCVPSTVAHSEYSS